MGAIECTIRKLEARVPSLIAGSSERDRISAEIAALRGSASVGPDVAEQVMAFRRHTQKDRAVRERRGRGG